MEFQNLQVSKTADTLIKIGSVALAIVAIAGLRSFYINNLYVPKVTVKSTDYNNGKAVVVYKNNEISLIGDATYLISGSWGVRFGSTSVDGDTNYDRIELLKSGMVYDYLQLT